MFIAAFTETVAGRGGMTSLLRWPYKVASTSFLLVKLVQSATWSRNRAVLTAGAPSCQTRAESGVELQKYRGNWKISKTKQKLEMRLLRKG